MRDFLEARRCSSSLFFTPMALLQARSAVGSEFSETSAARGNETSTPSFRTGCQDITGAEGIRERMRHLNMDGRPLERCSQNTGFLRDGYCAPHHSDAAAHTVCAVVDSEFLDFSAARGNDLKTSTPSFPGLVPGDHWCLCAARFVEAAREGKAPRLVRRATHESFRGRSEDARR